MTSVLPKPYKKQDIFDAIMEFLVRARQTGDSGETSGESAESAGMAVSTDEFDGDLYRDMLMGDIDSACELAAEYLGQTEVHLGLLEEDIRALNREAIRQAAHLIKGSSLNMTARRCADAAFAIEQGADAADGAKLVVMFKRLTAEFARLKEILLKEGFI
jgi:HPt (histidine-containing phosphotransfer) domain-containing protein